MCIVAHIIGVIRTLLSLKIGHSTSIVSCCSKKEENTLIFLCKLYLFVGTKLSCNRVVNSSSVNTGSQSNIKSNWINKTLQNKSSIYTYIYIYLFLIVKPWQLSYKKFFNNKQTNKQRPWRWHTLLGLIIDGPWHFLTDEATWLTSAVWLTKLITINSELMLKILRQVINVEESNDSRWLYTVNWHVCMETFEVPAVFWWKLRAKSSQIVHITCQL